MPLTRPDQEFAPSPDIMQRWASRHIGRRLTRHTALTEPDRAAVKKSRRWVILWAAMAGIISGTLIGGSEWWMRQVLVSDWASLSFREQLPYWAGYMVFAGFVTLLEIGFLYWNALRGVARVSYFAGLNYSSESPQPPTVELTLQGVARVALEYPSPGSLIYGVDPHAYLHGWKLTLRMLLYRLKVSMSSFLLRMVMRRLLGRLTLRGLLPMLMAPLYAVWNAWIAARVTEDAYLLACGPRQIERIMERLDDAPEQTRKLLAQGVGEMIMRNQHPHPNLVLALSRLLATLPDKPDSLEVDWPTALREYAALDEQQRTPLLESLTQTVLLSGGYRGARKKFLQEVFAHCQTPLTRAFIDEQQLDP
ncbi:LBF_2804 family protein [Vreelandella sp. EE27]